MLFSRPLPPEQEHAKQSEPDEQIHGVTKESAEHLAFRIINHQVVDKIVYLSQQAFYILERNILAVLYFNTPVGGLDNLLVTYVCACV